MQEPERIIDYLFQRGKEQPGAPFVADEFRSLTYGAFCHRVLETAAALQENAIIPGERVLLVLQHGIDHLISYFACIHSGYIPVHLSTSKPVEGILLAAQIAQAGYCIVQDYPGDLSEAPFRRLAFDTLQGNAQMTIPGYNTIAYMMFTSGTTGVPKAVMTSHVNTLATAHSIIDFAGTSMRDKELISLPLAFTFGLGHIHALILTGGQAFLTHRRYELGYLTEAIQQTRSTGFLASPAMLREMVTEHREQFKRCSPFLRYLVVNCTPMEPALTEQLLEILPETQIYMYYGMTEASRCAYIHYNSNRHRLDFTGKHALNVELRIDNPDTNGVGEICMRGANVMPGYWNNPEATAKVIGPGGWIRSGDLGIMDEDGYVKVLGRINDQISVDGMKCQPAEVENIIAQLPFVDRVTVCGISDTEKFQLVAAAIIPKGQLPENVAELVRSHCRAHLEAFKVPVIVETVDQFPANELGKVNRKQLASLLEMQTENA